MCLRELLSVRHHGLPRTLLVINLADVVVLARQYGLRSVGATMLGGRTDSTLLVIQVELAVFG
jgi:hypothetical protein